MLDSKGYIQQQEHRGEFVELFEFGPEDWTFNKWMKHCGLLLDRLTGCWYKEGKFPKLTGNRESVPTKKRGRPPSSIKEKIPKETPNIRLNAMQMVLDGLTDKEVAQKVGVNVGTVGKWKKKAGLSEKAGLSGKSGRASRGESLDRILERRQLAHSSQFSPEEE